MNITYIHHSCFLAETDRFYYLFDYEDGLLPELDTQKPIFVLSSHGHDDHYNPEVFSLLSGMGMQQIRGILSDDIEEDEIPDGADVLTVSPGQVYDPGHGQKLTTFRSTDLGVAFLIEDGDTLIYHAGDLNDWFWEGEPDSFNQQMTANYRQQIDLLAQKLNCRKLDAAFVVLDPRQESAYDRGLCHFLEKIPVRNVYPMHYWDNPGIIETFLHDHPEYHSQIQRTESHSALRGKEGQL